MDDIFWVGAMGVLYPELNMWMTYLSGSYVDVILVLYVTDIFEWERDNILICGWHIVNGEIGVNDYLKSFMNEVKHWKSIKID